MASELFWIFIQVGALLAIPLAALRSVQLWFLLRDGRFTYKLFKGEGIPTTRAEKPGWYLFAIAMNLLSLVASLLVIGFVGFWTFHPH